MTAADNDTTVLRYLADGPKDRNDFWRGGPGKSQEALMRCYRAGWADEAPFQLGCELWELTEAGRAELERRQA